MGKSSRGNSIFERVDTISAYRKSDLSASLDTVWDVVIKFISL